MASPAKHGGNGTFPLSCAGESQQVKLVSADCGRGLASRLVAMGIRRGATMTVVRSGNHGPLVIALGNLRVALGRGVAHKLLVAPSDGGNHDPR